MHSGTALKPFVLGSSNIIFAVFRHHALDRRRGNGCHPDFESIVVSDLDVDDIGNVFVKGDYLRSAHDYIAAKQRVRPHWQPRSNSDSSNNGRIPADQIAIAGLYAQSESSKKYTPPTGSDDMISDEQAAIAALFR